MGHVTRQSTIEIELPTLLDRPVADAAWPSNLLAQPGQPLAGLRIAIVHEWLETYAGSERVLEQLLACFPDADIFAVVQPLDEKFGHASGLGRQRFPGEDHMDGFFYALLHKRS